MICDRVGSGKTQYREKGKERIPRAKQSKSKKNDEKATRKQGSSGTEGSLGRYIRINLSTGTKRKKSEEIQYVHAKFDCPRVFVAASIR